MEVQVLDKLSATAGEQVKQRPWLDHLIRAGKRFTEQRGDFYAAGITYFTVLSIFPLLMVAFSIAGFVLAGHPDLLAELQDKIADSVSGDLGVQLNDIIDQAINSRGTVGVLGLLTGLYTGLGWMNNLRTALTEQWRAEAPKRKFLAKKLSDLGALLGLGLAFLISIGLSVVRSSRPAKAALEAVGLGDVPGAQFVLAVISTLLGLLATWAVFAWIIARLPLQPVTLHSAAKAALLAAVAFEIFKFFGAVYLQSVMKSPAGATFGSVIGLLVFAYITYRILLFATAWAATAADNRQLVPAEVPGPAVIRPRVVEHAGAPAAGAAWFGAGALATAGLMLLGRRSKRR